MTNFTTEAKVGVFVLIGIIGLTYLTFKIGSLSFKSGDEGLQISALFSSIAGLEAGANVRYAGVKIGTVKSIELKDDLAKVEMALFPGVNLRSDAVATVASLGLLGEKYIEIKGGTSQAPLVQHNGAVKGSSPTSLDQLVESINSVGDDLKAITQSFREVVGSEEGKNALERILLNVDKISEDLKGMVANNTAHVDEILSNIDTLTTDLKELVVSNQESVSRAVDNFESISQAFYENMPSILENLDKVLANMTALVADNRINVDETLDNMRLATRDLRSSMENIDAITTKINAGQGTLGKLVADDETHTNLNTALEGLTETLDEAKAFLGGLSSYQTYLGYRGEYLENYQEWRNIISVKIQPRKDKYYLLEIVDSPFGSTTWEEQDITTESSVTGTEVTHIRKETTSDDLLFSLQVAKRLNAFTFRGGLIESTGGVGADLSLWRDNVTFTVEGYDFGREDNFHLRVGSEIKFLEYFRVFGGLDDVLIDDNRSGYFGAGLSFADEDFKFIMGLLPMANLTK